MGVAAAGELGGVGNGDLGPGDGLTNAGGEVDTLAVAGAEDALIAGLGTDEDPAPHAAQMIETAAASTQERCSTLEFSLSTGAARRRHPSPEEEGSSRPNATPVFSSRLKIGT